jgi:hypothetical protein
MARRLGLAFALVFLGVVCAVGQTYTDADLLREGKTAWDANKCVRASRFFFAYLLRAPLDQDARQRGKLEEAIRWCESRTAFAGGTKGDDPGSRPITPPPVSPPPDMSGVTLAVPTSSAQKRCAMYARVAAAQAEVFLASGCGGRDSRWDPAFTNHYNWCMAVGAPTANQETAVRQQLFDQCAP